MSLTRQVLLSKGQFAIVDAEDYEWISSFKWHFLKVGYAARSGPRPNRKMFYMHREIMKASPGLEIDHINGNRLDNRRENLRICTRIENGKNLPISARNKSGHKGVWFRADRSKWTARIIVNRERINLGCFETYEEAVSAYKIAADKYFEEYNRILISSPR